MCSLPSCRYDLAWAFGWHDRRINRAMLPYSLKTDDTMIEIYWWWWSDQLCVFRKCKKDNLTEISQSYFLRTRFINDVSGLIWIYLQIWRGKSFNLGQLLKFEMIKSFDNPIRENILSSKRFTKSTVKIKSEILLTWCRHKYQVEGSGARSSWAACRGWICLQPLRNTQKAVWNGPEDMIFCTCVLCREPNKPT